MTPNDRQSMVSAGGSGRYATGRCIDPPCYSQKTLRNYVHCLLHSEVGGPGEEEFYRLAEEDLVIYDPRKIQWRSYKVAEVRMYL